VAKIFRISTLIIFWILCIMAPSAMATGEAVIAVAADGETAEAAVSRQAARCPYFLLFDARGVFVEAVANPHRQAAGGAGPQVVAFLAAKGVQTVIAGEFGGRMTTALQGKGMEFRIATGSAAAAVLGIGQQ
jgi:predicted Fe-Mo cluster-binding NifX family protein